MREIRTSGSMRGERKRGDAEWPKPPRLSSTLPKQPNQVPIVHDCSTPESRRKNQAGEGLSLTHRRHLRLRETVEFWSVTPSYDKLIEIGAKVASRGRYVVLHVNRR
tara:strand:- start:7 stop:327 length:321 start_codon:yes stop_codon:yes gene_type:complete